MSENKIKKDQLNFLLPAPSLLFKYVCHLLICWSCAYAESKILVL